MSRKKALEERPLARRDLEQPADEEQPRAQVGVHHRPGALQDEAAHQLRTAEPSSCETMLPPEKPATCAEDTSSARRTAAASSAIASTETGASGIAVRPATRLSNAVRR